MKKYLALLLVGIMVIGLVACDNKAQEKPAETAEVVEEKIEEAVETVEETVESKKSKLDVIKESGKLIMGTNANYPPFEFHKQVDGKDQIMGFDIFIANEIAKDLGVELEIQDMDFSAVLAAMETEVVDVGIAGISKTPAREETMDFTDVYYVSSYIVLVKAGDEGKFNTPEKLTEAKARVGVQTATVQEGIANDIEGIEIISIAKTPDLVAQLKSGYVDAIITEKSVADLYAAQNEDLASDTEATFGGAASGAAIAVPKGQPELLAEINKTIQKLQAEGKIEEFYQEALKIAAEE